MTFFTESDKLLGVLKEGKKESLFFFPVSFWMDESG